MSIVIPPDDGGGHPLGGWDLTGAPIPPDVGDFRAGTPVTRWALARYLVGRSLGRYVSGALLVVALVVLLLGALLVETGPAWLGVLMVIAAVVVLAFRALLGAILRRVFGLFGPDGGRLRSLVSATSKDVRRELRAIGLPSRAWTMPLLIVRLAGKRRAETLQRLRQFDVSRAVPAGRLDELHLLVQQRTRGA